MFFPQNAPLIIKRSSSPSPRFNSHKKLKILTIENDKLTKKFKSRSPPQEKKKGRE
jgi:hypothetical protein